jgi:hypothetical protein
VVRGVVRGISGCPWYGTTRSRRFLVVSARTRSCDEPGPGRRCPASTAPRGAAPRHGPVRASPA